MSMAWQLSPLFHPAAIVLLGLALFTVLAYGSWLLVQKHVPRRSIVLLGLLRAGMVVLLVLGLFQPVLSVPRAVVDAPGLLVLVDTSASMSSPAAKGSRLEDVKQQLAKSPAIQSAGRTHALHWFTFDRRAYPLASPNLDQAVPNGDGTDVAAGLKSAWNYVRLWNASREIASTPSRALIVSDGQQRSSADVVATAKELGISLDVLGPSLAPGQSETAAAEIPLVQAAQRVLIGSETAFQVTVRPHQVADSLSLVVEEDGQEIERRGLTGLAAGQDHFEVIAHRPKEAGLKRYRFQLMQGETPLGEPYAVNVQAVDDRHDVLILEDSWRWEFKYLRRVLEDDPSFSLTAMLARGENSFVQFGEPERRVKLGGFPQSRSELDGFDTIVLGDVRPASWPRGLARHISGAVSDGGKSLVVLAGVHLGDWIETPELTRLLPVELTRDSGLPMSGQVEVRITPEGKASSWFALTEKKGDATSEIAATLPALEHVYPVLRKRPAATVLLETAGQQNAYGPFVVIAEQTVGRGRVLFVATDTLWRWQTHGPRTDDGVTLHSAFWQHAFRALAPTQPTSRRRQLFLRPEQTQYRVGDSVRASVELSADEETSPPVLEGTVILPDGRRLPLALQSYEHLGGSSMAQFEPTQSGRYQLGVTARSDGQTIAEASVVLEVASRGNERDGSPVDYAALERWASATGGRAIDPSSPDGWLGTATPPPTTVVRRQSFDLWHNFSLLLLLCTLFAADWTLRLFRGYV